MGDGALSVSPVGARNCPLSEAAVPQLFPQIILELNVPTLSGIELGVETELSHSINERGSVDTQLHRSTIRPSHPIVVKRSNEQLHSTIICRRLSLIYSQGNSLAF